MSSVGVVSDTIKLHSLRGVDGVSGVKKPGIDAAPMGIPGFSAKVGEGRIE